MGWLDNVKSFFKSVGDFFGNLGTKVKNFFTEEEVIEAIEETEEVEDIPVNDTALIACTSMLEEESQVVIQKQDGPFSDNGNVVLHSEDIEFNPEFTGCLGTDSQDKKCIPMIQGRKWQDCDTETVDGKEIVLMEQSYMLCPYGRGMIYLTTNGQILPSMERKREAMENNQFFSEEDYNYLVALGQECPNYEGFLAVAYSVMNRAEEREKTIREIVTAKNQYAGFSQDEVGNPRNEEVKRAAMEALTGAVENPIGRATFFFGRVNKYDLWYEEDKCHYIKEVEGNVFYATEDYGYVHNMLSKKTDDAVVIYSSTEGKWLKRGLIVDK